MQKRFILFICAVLLLLCTSCSSDTPTSTKVVTLDSDEQLVLDAMGDDIKIVSEEDYPITVTELVAHTASYTGQVYQIEGIFTMAHFNDGNPFVYRTLINGNTKTIAGLPLKFLTKEIDEGSWVRVTGIINEGTVDGTKLTVLEVVAIETVGERGNAELTWSGSSHNHEH